jgi:hemoglobin
MEEGDVFAAIGEDGFRRLTAAFYRQVPADPILGPMYPPEDMEGAEERLRDFLIFRFGGPPDYLAKRGHPRLRMRHGPFAIDSNAAAQWLKLMRRAMDETKLPEETEALLWNFFANTAPFLRNRPDLP